MPPVLDEAKLLDDAFEFLVRIIARRLSEAGSEGQKQQRGQSEACHGGTPAVGAESVENPLQFAGVSKTMELSRFARCR
jgi:hypothetical protein